MNLSQSESWAMNTFGQNISSLFITDLLSDFQASKTDSLHGYRTFIGLSSVPQDPYWNLSAPGHPQFVFASHGSGNGYANDLFVTNCATGTTYVDVQVTCISKGALGKANCGVDAVRKTLESPGLSDAGFLEALRMDDHVAASRFDPRVARGFLAAFTDMLDENQIGGGQESIIERYLTDPMTAFDGRITFQFADLGSLDVKLVEKRLSLLYNTLWKVGWSYGSMTGGNMTNYYQELYDGKVITSSTLVNVTSQTVQPLQPVYVLDVPWLILYFVSVGVMLLAAVASLLLHAKCHTPPILGYVSSLVRDSVFFSDSGVQGNSTEGGASKAGRLAKMEVKIADVWSEESVGRVAFAPAQGRGVVKKWRHYE